MSGAGGERDRQMAMVVLGLCPAVVASTRVLDALFLAAGTVVILAALSVLLPLLRTAGRLPASRLPARIAWAGLLLSSCLTAVYEMALNALAPAALSRLGIYVPLVSVSLLTAGRLDALSAPVSLRHALKGVVPVAGWYSVILVVVSAVREVLGSGTITLGTTIPVAPFFADPARAAGFAGGALICLGYAAAAARLITRGRAADDLAGSEPADGRGPG